MQDLEDLHGHILEAQIEMYPTSFLCNNRLAKRGLIIAMMMTMTLDLVEDITMRALDLMAVVVMIVDLRLDAVIQGLLHIVLDLHQDPNTPPQVLVHLEWSRFLQ